MGIRGHSALPASLCKSTIDGKSKFNKSNRGVSEQQFATGGMNWKTVPDWRNSLLFWPLWSCQSLNLYSTLLLLFDEFRGTFFGLTRSLRKQWFHINTVSSCLLNFLISRLNSLINSLINTSTNITMNLMSVWLWHSKIKQQWSAVRLIKPSSSEIFPPI